MESEGNEVRNVVRKKSKFLSKLIIIVSAVIVISIVTVILYRVFYNRIHNSDSISALYDKWEQYDYEEVYRISNRILESKPFHNTARTFKGYSAFFLSVSQTDNNLSLQYIDESINNLRIALENCKEDLYGQLNYMLGKAYYVKNSLSSYHYYSELCIKYLEEAKKSGYQADDISQYLGLSYASLDEYQKSIEALTETLLTKESDTLLLTIARQYYKNGSANASKQYLVRASAISDNIEIISNCHLLLGKIYLDEGNYKEAEKEFNIILQKNENSADAHYELGVLYEKQGEMIKARSEWRKCLKIQVDHPEAIQKMAQNNLK